MIPMTKMMTMLAVVTRRRERMMMIHPPRVIVVVHQRIRTHRAYWTIQGWFWVGIGM